jgi:cell division protein FtsN
MTKHTKKQVSITYENGLYKVRVQGSSGEENNNLPISKWEQPKSNSPVSQNPKNADSRQKVNNNKQYISAIQVGAFVKQYNAIGVEKKLEPKIDYQINLMFENGFYKVRISGFQSRKQAVAFLPKLFEMDFTKAYIVNIQQP